MKKNALFLLMLLCIPVIVNAYDAQIDGIYYNLDKSEKTATVTFYSLNNNSKAYSGDVIIPSEVTFQGVTYTVIGIGDSAFYGCIGLTSATIPNSVISIGGDAFNKCSGLTSVTIPNNVTIIDDYAFYGCSSLKSVTIPNSVKEIGYFAFYQCIGLTSVVIPNSVTTIGDAFYGCSGLTSVTIGNSVTSIIDETFYGCSSLTSVTIPNSVTSIGNSAFYGCSSLTSVTIGNSVTSIGKKVFSDCYRLNTIYCLCTTPPNCENEVFICETNNVSDPKDVYNYAILHIPTGTKELYSSAYEWRYFKNVKEDVELNVDGKYVDLTIKMGTLGYTRQAVKAAETYTIYIGSLGDNKVNTVLFNGIDVTNSIVNGYYTTPVINGESELSISFESETSVKSMQEDNLKVSGYNGEIRVQNIEKPSDIYVYSVDGKLVNSAISTIGSASIQVDSDQLYMVKVGNRTFKVAL